ncbi:acyl-CoA dehydrogenase family protein [Membranihabitans marinus]|uniref:acyl-CoA dehydrogenase family protein n=1 Tax=Membranihabitans marinus TaxID=1227546 RepID=UPI001F16E132|nr:acyl-CoA dehydrogenase family protein [Membranihabitans marinus]
MRKNSNHRDYFGLESKLSDADREIQQSIRQWVDQRILPEIETHAQNHSMDIRWMTELAELGCFGGQLSKEKSGRDWSYLTYGLAMQELERGDSGLRTMASVQGGLVMYPIAEFGSEEQQQKYLSKLATGQCIGCFGMTESRHGSNPKGMETRLVAKDDYFLLRGDKAWITNASIADIGIIWAKNEEDHIVAVLLDMKKNGVSVKTIDDKWSLRASITSHILMDDVRIEASDILPHARGLRSALTCLNKARFGIAWGAVGAALACCDTAMDYACNREQFGKPLAQFQMVQKKLAETVTAIAQAQLMNYRLAELADNGQVTAGQISMAKRANVEMALNTARTCRQILGAEGLRSSYPIMRHLMNLETLVTYEGSHDIHLLITGQEITGYNAFT